MTLPPHLIRAALAAAFALAASPSQAIAVAPPPDLAGWVCTGSCGASAADGDIVLSPLGNPQYGWVGTSDSAAFGVSPLALDANSRGNGVENNGSRFVSGAFHANAGDRLDLRFNYVSTDGKGFDDYAWARVVDAGSNALVAWLFTARSSNSSTGKIVPGDVVDKKAFDPDVVIVDYKDYNFTSKTVEDPIDWSRLGFSNGSCWKDNAPGCGFTGWLHSRVSFAAAGNYRVEVGVVNWGDSAYDSGLAFDFAGLVSTVPEPQSFMLALAGLALFAWRGRRGADSR
jgi:hypothetical protein